MILKQRIDLILANENILNMGPENIDYNALKATKIELGEDFSKITYFGFSIKNKLEMSQQKIISAVKEAFKKGRFILSEDTQVQVSDKP
jgi:glycine betaine/choline ABC-type transport system substrate-binding protein